MMTKQQEKSRAHYQRHTQEVKRRAAIYRANNRDEINRKMAIRRAAARMSMHVSDEELDRRAAEMMQRSAIS